MYLHSKHTQIMLPNWQKTHPKIKCYGLIYFLMWCVVILPRYSHLIHDIVTSNLLNCCLPLSLTFCDNYFLIQTKLVISCTSPFMLIFSALPFSFCPSFSFWLYKKYYVHYPPLHTYKLSLHKMFYSLSSFYIIK